MPRYGCYEIRTECDHCGNPVPINGPVRRVQCTYCREWLKIAPERLKDVLEDLPAEYEKLAKGEGSGGTIMSDRTYKYGYWKLPPRCSECDKPLAVDDVPVGRQSELMCPEGHSSLTYPAPAWLLEKLPGAEQIYGGEKEVPEGSTALQADAGEPIVMACPQCAGALSVDTGSDRVPRCQYCESQVFIPDALWKRLHPVKKVTEWFIRFADPASTRPAREPSPPEPSLSEIVAARRPPSAEDDFFSEPVSAEPPQRLQSRAPIVLLAVVGAMLAAGIAVGMILMRAGQS